jgi:hypothetical protein
MLLCVQWDEMIAYDGVECTGEVDGGLLQGQIIWVMINVSGALAENRKEKLPNTSVKQYSTLQWSFLGRSAVSIWLWCPAFRSLRFDYRGWYDCIKNAMYSVDVEVSNHTPHSNASILRYCISLGMILSARLTIPLTINTFLRFK